MASVQADSIPEELYPKLSRNSSHIIIPHDKIGSIPDLESARASSRPDAQLGKLSGNPADSKDHRSNSSFRSQPECDHELLLWVQQRIKNAFAAASGEDKVKKMFSMEENTQIIIDFLVTEAERLLVIYTDGTGSYQTAKSIPPAYKLPGLYFLKPASVKITKENIANSMVVCDLMPNPLDSLMLLTKEVFFPLMSNPRNQETWPEIISKEINENFDNFLGNTYVTIGKTVGKTLLPLPYQTEFTSSTQNEKIGKEKERVHILENSVVMWTKQIKAVLKQDPEVLSKGGKNPGPQVEVEFWASKAQNLNSLQDQLRPEKIGKIVSILEMTKSTFYPAFDRLCKEVSHAQAEANDNLMYLKPAAKYFALLLNTDFVHLQHIYRPIMHMVLLIWKHSKFFNTPARLAVLVRELCNDIIRKACEYMGNEGIWSSEPRQITRKLTITIGQCVAFKDVYFIYKTRSSEICRENPWRVQNSIIFARLENFIERCHDVLMQTVTQFSSLCSLEIGGTKGKTFTSSVQQIYIDFQQSISHFMHSSYDIMDVDCKEFEEHFYNFRLHVHELERRLASVIIQAFDDSTTILGQLKLLDSFEGLLLREGLSSELERKYAELLIEYLQDMNQVRDIFLVHIKAIRQHPKPASVAETSLVKTIQQQHISVTASHIPQRLVPVMDNAPPRAGAIIWIRGLLQRAEDPMQRIQSIGTFKLDTEPFKKVESAYHIITTMLREAEAEFIKEWEMEMSQTSEAKLRLPLLVKDASGELHVNFDSSLICLLREIKYFLTLDVNVPEAASAIYKNEDTFRVYTGNLEMIANLYNSMCRTVLEVERPLIQNQMEQVEQCLSKGMKHMNWKSHSISDFISQCMSVVTETYNIVTAIKKNVQDIQKIVDSWSQNVMMKRRSTKTYLCDDMIETQQVLILKSFAEMSLGGERIHGFLSVTQKLLRANKGSAQFKAYLEYINDILISGLVKASVASCKYLLDQINPVNLENTDVAPLLEIQLLLTPPKLIFSPELKNNSMPMGIRTLILYWARQFCSIGSLIKRIDSANGEGDYFAEVQDHLEVKYIVSQITKLLDDNEKRCEDFRGRFEDYAYLWQEKIDKIFAQFLAAETLPGYRMPPLQTFAVEVNTYRALEDEIRALAGATVVGWLKVDVRPLKNSLLGLIGKWKEKFQQYPLRYVEETIRESLAFMRKAMSGLEMEVVDAGSLELVLSHLRDVRKCAERMNVTLEPLSLTVTMLAKYGVNVSQEIQEDLESACVLWEQLKRKADSVKATYESLQSDEAVALKDKSKAFEEKLKEFRRHFLQKMPFVFSDNFIQAFEMIDQMHHGNESHGNLRELEKEAARLNELQDCFEIAVTRYDNVVQSLKEAKLLKVVWDNISAATLTYNALKVIKWNNVDIQALLDVNTLLVQQVRSLNEEVKGWSLYSGLESFASNMHSSLMLVKELGNPYLRSRHWKQLMRITGVSFAIDERFLLGDMLVLQLFLYQEPILELVEKACKEFDIEQRLNRLEQHWNLALLKLCPHETETDIQLIVVDDSIVGALHDDIELLQNLQGSRFVQGTPSFLETVMMWQQKLGTVDAVLVIWVQLQSKWEKLHSIFLVSMEAREQLPEYAMRFDLVHEEWRSLMRQVASSPLIVEACSVESRSKHFEDMIEELEKCEVVLGHFLEVKRRAYPRFFFVSSTDLLHLLSKSKHPSVLVHLFQFCFHSLCKLKFKDPGGGDNGDDAPVATGMFSRTDEYVPFYEDFEFKASVEIWMQHLTQHMQLTIQLAIQTSVSRVKETLFVDFVLESPAQIALTAIQICFTSDVEKAFDALDQGSENDIKEFKEAHREQAERFLEALSLDLSENHRRKVCSVVIAQFYHQDVISRLIGEMVGTRQSFQWQSRLRFRLDLESGNSAASIGFHRCNLGNEYVGNHSRIVITPLTERCFLSFAEAMRLNSACLLVGNRGVGKSETIHDLGRALGVMVYSYNCSPEMDRTSFSNIFKGLAQTGIWLCLEGFQRISSSILSVLSTHWGCILNAVRTAQLEVTIEDEILKVNMKPCCCMFAVMDVANSDSANLSGSARSLFRPCGMIHPDTAAILEVLLLAEGFGESKFFAHKLATLSLFAKSLLSPQLHYDWSIHILKRIVTDAGSICRREKVRQEDQAILHVLLDTVPQRLVQEDIATFMGLLHDFFPGDLDFVGKQHVAQREDTIVNASLEYKLQPKDKFLAKVLQLQDLLITSGSVFVLGSAGCGKSEIIKVIMKAKHLAHERTVSHILNPKSVTILELFGHMETKTREWKDGVFTRIFKESASAIGFKHQYIILDGDVDSQWLDYLNNVLDDTKKLIINSNECIPLNPSMRLLFETHSLKNISPAAIARGSVLYMHDMDAGWPCFLESWLQSRDSATERWVFKQFFEENLDNALMWTRNVKTIVPMSDLHRVTSLCYILESFIGDGNDLSAVLKKSGSQDYQHCLECLAASAMVWGLGGACTDKNPARATFDKIWRENMTKIKFPEQGTVFEYFFHISAGIFVPWNSQVPTFSLANGQNFTDVFVQNAESLPLIGLNSTLIQHKRSVMFVGLAGTGKTTLAREKIRSLDHDLYSFSEMSFHHYSDSLSLQLTIERGLVKKSGRVLSPIGIKRLIFFVDDFNLPAPDAFGSQQPHALIKQQIDHGFWYDRHKLLVSEVQNVQFQTCMNPATGSFHIDTRLQRSFCTFAVYLPTEECLFQIYSSIVVSHFQTFDESVQHVASKALISALLNVFASVKTSFLLNHEKFHYVFNMRDLSAVVQGLCRVSAAFCNTESSLISLWMHETDRVFGDKLISAADTKVFQKSLNDVCLKWFDEFCEIQKITSAPLVYTTFFLATVGKERPYCKVHDHSKLSKIIEEKLVEHNSSHAVMNLVIFEQVVFHICRITRIIDKPFGSAMIGGTGGVGKQSLAKLSAFVCGFEVYQYTTAEKHSESEFVSYLKQLFVKTGVNNVEIALVIASSHISDERSLVPIQDFLSSGNVVMHYSNQEQVAIIEQVRAAVIKSGRIDTKESCWDFFTTTIRQSLHICLCFSPTDHFVKGSFRRLPALWNCTSFDYIHPWSQDALSSVAIRSLEARCHLDESVAEGIGQHMSFVHNVAGGMSHTLERENRYNDITPKSFFDFIDLFAEMLDERKLVLAENKIAFSNGLEKLSAAMELAKGLYKNLVDEMEIVEEKTEAANTVLDQISKEQAYADGERTAASEDEERAHRIAEDVAKYQRECDENLASAEPILAEAQAALLTIDKKSLAELKALVSPPPGVEDVTAGVLVLLSRGALPKDLTWNAAKKLLNNVDNLIRTLSGFDKTKIHESACTFCEKMFLSKESFNVEKMRSKSTAAAGMCAWVINICKYFRILQDVEPRRALLVEANERLARINAELSEVRNHLASIDRRLSSLAEQFQASTKDKNDAQRAAELTKQRIDLADRLMRTLAEERENWTFKVSTIDLDEMAVVGDVLLSCAFVSYAGPFDLKSRNLMLQQHWVPDMHERRIALSPESHPVGVLAEPAAIANWKIQGLPPDELCIQNAAIITKARRWPLVIDPQSQCLPWIKAHFRRMIEPEHSGGEKRGSEQDLVQFQEVVLIRVGRSGWIKQLQVAVSTGESVLLHLFHDTIDPCLQHLLCRTVIKRAKANFIVIGDVEVEMDSRFRLCLYIEQSNPHFRAEIVAQTAIVDFTTTFDGLQERLLRLVFKGEKPEIELQDQALNNEENVLSMKLRDLQREMLYNLTNFEGDLLSNTELVESLEETKRGILGISEQQRELKRRKDDIAAVSAMYQSVALHGAVLCTIIERLWVLDHNYRFSMHQIQESFLKGIALGRVRENLPDEMQPRSSERGSEGGAAARRYSAAGVLEDKSSRPHTADIDSHQRRSSIIDEARQGRSERLRSAVKSSGHIRSLTEEACYSVFSSVAMCMSEKHRVIFASDLGLRLALQRGAIDENLLQFLLQGGRHEHFELNPMKDWLENASWSEVLSLQELQSTNMLPDGTTDLQKPFEGLSQAILTSQKRFRDWFELERPEEAPLPSEWRKVSNLNRLFIIRALRPDRVSQALAAFVRAELGPKYLKGSNQGLQDICHNGSTGIPILFLRHMASDPTKNLEAIGKDLGFELEKGNFSMMSLVHDQPSEIEDKMKDAMEVGAWIYIQDLHFNPKWTASWLEMQCADLSLAHADFRMFLSADVSSQVPISVLKACMKYTHEDPIGLKSILLNSIDSILAQGDESQAVFPEPATVDSDLKSIVFALSTLHAIITERARYSPIGWNVPYKFSGTDLLRCMQITQEIMKTKEETGLKFSWSDLRLYCNDILYGGHMVDVMDAVCLKTYMDQFLSDEYIQGSELLPGVKMPDLSMGWEELRASLQHLEFTDSPSHLGMHPNVQIPMALSNTRCVLSSIADMHFNVNSSFAGTTLQERASSILDDIVEKLPALLDISPQNLSRAEDRGPCFQVFLQEAERMNGFLRYLRESLTMLILGLDCHVHSSGAMDAAVVTLVENRVPGMWEESSYPTVKSLSLWVVDLHRRVRQLESWVRDLGVPKVTWLSGLCFPHAFLVAVTQSAARRNDWRLDNAVLVTEVTRKGPEDIAILARDGAYVHGLFLQGARWDDKSSSLEDIASRLLLTQEMPVILVKVVTREQVEVREDFDCPVYRTSSRGGAGFVFASRLKSRHPPSRWVQAGVAMLMEIGC